MTTETTAATTGSYNPLNRHELVSINALLTYTAFKKQISEAHMRKTVAKRFGVDDIGKLPGAAYDDIIQFLANIQAETLAHEVYP